MTDNIDVMRGLAQTGSEATFLQKLAAVYRQMSIGPGLDFGDVQRYWRAEAPLPQAWRQTLAQRLWLGADAGAEPSFYQLPSRIFHSWADAELAEEDLLDFGERMVVLLAPFCDLAQLPEWLLSSTLFNAGGGGVIRSDSRRWITAQMHAMQRWADELAEGSGDWLPVHRWYVTAGAQPQALSAALRSISQVYWQDGHLCPLVAMRTLMLLVREQLQSEPVPDDTWLTLLLRFVNCTTSYRWDDLRREQWLVLQRNLALPLLRVLLRSDELARLVGESQNAQSSFNVLFHKMGLAYLLAEQPETFRAVLRQLPDAGFKVLRLPSGFVDCCPQATLDFEQARYARFADFSASLGTPEALQWYRQIVLKEPRDSQSFVSSFTRLVEHVDDAELDSLIWAYYFSEAASSFPHSLGTRNNRALLTTYLDALCQELAEAAAWQLFELASSKRDGYSYLEPRLGDCVIDLQGWAALLSASAQHPDLFANTGVSAHQLVRGADRLERWQLLWNRVSAPSYRQPILWACSRPLEYASLRPEVFAFLADCYAQEPQLLEDHLVDSVERLQGCPQRLWPLLVVLAARRIESEPAARRGTIRRLQALQLGNAIAANPQTYAALNSKLQLLLLPLFNSAALLACADTLGKVLASGNKAVRDPVVALIASCTADIIQRSGLLPGAAKARPHLLTGIALSRDPLMAPLIAEYFHDPAHDEQSRGLSLDALENACYPLQGLDPWAGLDLAGFQAEANKQPGERAEGVWNDEFATLLHPLGEPLGRFLLALMQRADRLPRRARQILACLSAGQCAEFALLGVNGWITANGANEFLWLLQPMREYGDERAANALVKAVKDWKKFRTQKSVLAIALLCELPGHFGCYLARDLWENGKLTASIKASANAALAAAAERRGLSLEDFLEVLAPDFGMGPQGLVLDVGPYNYTVRIRSDLSLVVFDAAGKASKSLPKARADEDKGKREQAESQFKALAKNLKPVLKQQGQRLLRALQLGQSWSASTWQRLFIEHPLLNLIAQNVVWSALDEQGAALKRFRPDSDGGLLDLDDARYLLPESCTVQVTHPMELDNAERAAWVAHFADYELVSPIDQWGTAVQHASDEELQANKVLRASGKVLSRGTLSGLLERWGYQKGASEDGGVFTQHSWSPDGERWQVIWAHSEINVGYFDADDQIEMEALAVYQRVGDELQAQCLGDLPAALRNTLLVQAQSLAEAGQ
ncbi:MAG TPA: DUF4132 domain-containing protein [Pseudomonas sp.]|nr:DUF4132 domain-containing protein [Pseudomonas sp.]